MNNYDYFNYITNVPNTFESNLLTQNKTKMYDTSNINYMPPKNNIPQNKNNNQILQPYEGFKRGNLFHNLYVDYLNYTPAEITPKSEQEALLNQWQQYNFALTELNLYLDVYPNDAQATTLYKKYLDIKNEIENKYEEKYGPLCVDSKYVTNDNWKWIKNPWPWEGVK